MQIRMILDIIRIIPGKSKTLIPLAKGTVPAIEIKINPMIAKIAPAIIRSI